MQDFNNTVYEFGPFLLDAAEKILLKNDKPIALTPKAFETLVALVERRGRLIEKEELLKEIWADSFVEEGNLSQNIYLLRKALGEGSERFIETVPKRGYRFIADVIEKRVIEKAAARDYGESHSLDADASVISLEANAMIDSEDNFESDKNRNISRRKYLIPTAAISAIAISLIFWIMLSNISEVPIRSLAVLPFKPLGDESGDELLGLGMADATIIKLSNLQKFPVLPTSTIIKYAGREHNPLEVGKALGVDAVLEGTVQHADDRVRVSVQLVGLRNGRTLWSGIFDEKFTNIFGVQDSISEQVAAALAVQVTGEEKRLLNKRYTSDAEAYQAYIRGVYFWNKRTEDGFSRSIHYFKEAIGRDPNYALAHAGLADVYGLVGYYGYKTLSADEAHEKSRESVEKALQLDDAIPEAHTALGMLKAYYENDMPKAEKEYKRAIALNPNYATARQRFGIFLLDQGRLDEAIEEIKRAQQLDPLSSVINYNVGLLLYLKGDYEKSQDYCLKAIESESNLIQPHITLALIDEQRGLHKEAEETLKRAKETALGMNYVATLESLGFIYGATGRKEEAEKVLLELEELSKQNDRVGFSMAIVNAGLRRNDAAFELLRKSAKDWTSMPFTLRFDPRLSALRSDERFKEFL